jgi:predicted dehydrogenase
MGVLGAGAMGAVHASAYTAMSDDVEVVGVFSRNQERAQAVASICHARPFASVEALLAEVDAVDVCLPTPVHRQYVVPALESGRHVFCETPLALRLDDARHMRDAARRAGRLLQVGLLMRSIAAYQYLKAAVASGTHGRLLNLATLRLGSYLRPDAPDHRPHYGEPTVELMTFDFDIVLWLMGEPRRLSASGEGEIAAVLDYGDGRSASVTASGLMPPGFPFTVGFRALFERAVFELKTVFAGGPPIDTFTAAIGKEPPRSVGTPNRNPYEVELRHFLECIAGKAEPALLDADRAIEALVLSQATQRALGEHRTIDIDLGDIGAGDIAQP